MPIEHIINLLDEEPGLKGPSSRRIPAYAKRVSGSTRAPHSTGQQSRVKTNKNPSRHQSISEFIVRSIRFKSFVLILSVPLLDA
jgi:hypothetical protein